MPQHWLWCRGYLRRSVMTTKKLTVDAGSSRIFRPSGREGHGYDITVWAEVRKGQSDDELMVEDDTDWLHVTSGKKTIEVSAGNPTITVPASGKTESSAGRIPDFDMSFLSPRMFDSSALELLFSRRGPTRDAKGNPLR